MSMKRTKQTSQGSRDRGAGDGPLFAKKAPEVPKPWVELVEGVPDEVFLPYTLSTKFDKDARLLHPKFGKGVVLRVEGARIEVRFSEGDKTLGHAS